MSIALPLHVRQTLKNLGFSDNDIVILSYVFSAQKSTLKEISHQTSISYSTCQYLTTNLLRLGILSLSVEAGAEFLTICSLEFFLHWIDEQKKQAEEPYSNAKKEISLFMKMVKESSWKPDMVYHEGAEGIKEIYEDMLKTNRDICAWTDISLIEKALGKTYLKSYITRRVRAGLKSFSILRKNPINILYSKKKQKRETKLVSELPIKGEIRIFGNKVAVITFNKKHPVGFVLESALIAEMSKTIFHDVWGKTR